MAKKHSSTKSKGLIQSILGNRISVYFIATLCFILLIVSFIITYRDVHEMLANVLPEIGSILFTVFVVDYLHRHYGEKQEESLYISQLIRQMSNPNNVIALQAVKELRQQPEYKSDMEKYLREGILSKKVFSGANLHKADMDGAKLQGSYFDDANLSEADLSNAHVEGAFFINANLSGTIFSGAFLTGTNFEDANLEGANLADTDLSGAKFLNANLRGANLTDASGIETAHFDEDTRLPNDTLWHKDVDWGQFIKNS